MKNRILLAYTPQKVIINNKLIYLIVRIKNFGFYERQSIKIQAMCPPTFQYWRKSNDQFIILPYLNSFLSSPSK